MRLGRLTGLEVVRLQKEIDDLITEIAWLKRLLAEDELVFDIIREDLADIESKYAEPRRTSIGEGIQDFLTEDLITEETMVVTISSSGYVKRTVALPLLSKTRDKGSEFVPDGARRLWRGVFYWGKKWSSGVLVAFS